MSIFETIDLRELNSVTELSRTEKSRVTLVSLENGREFAVLKEYQNKDLFPLYERLKSVQLDYFPRIYQLQEQEDAVVLLEEYLPGETLQAQLEGEKKLTEEELTGYIRAISEALQALHNATPPIVYRDLKPENIIITSHNKLKIVDFDAVREYKEEQSRDTIILGTKEYASPEQYGFMQTDIRTDVYSLGIVFAELLERADVSTSYRTDAKEIIKKATMFAPDDRYPNMEAFLKDLDKIGKRRSWLIPVGAFCICLVLAAGIIWWRNTGTTQETGAESAHQNGLTVSTEPTAAPVAEPLPEPTAAPVAEPLPEPTQVPASNPEDEASTEPTPLPIDEWLEQSTEPPLYATVYEDYCAKLPDIEQNHSWIYSGVGAIDGMGEYDGFYSDLQETIAGNGFRAVRFLKAYPRPIMFDHVCVEDLPLEQVWYSKYDEATMADGEWIQLETEHYYESYPSVWALSTEWLETLEPGVYTFWLYYGRELFGYYLVVHDEADKVDNFFIRACCELAFYSSEVKNDVYLYFQNMPYPIAEVSIDGQELKEGEYELVEEGYGVLLHPETLQRFEHLIAADIVIITEDGHKGSSRIVFLNTMVPQVAQ